MGEINDLRSEDEHDLFLKGLGKVIYSITNILTSQKYGPDWERIAADIPTRTKLQVRTHASKCFHLTEIREKKRKKSDNEER